MFSSEKIQIAEDFFNWWRILFQISQIFSSILFWTNPSLLVFDLNSISIVLLWEIYHWKIKQPNCDLVTLNDDPTNDKQIDRLTYADTLMFFVSGFLDNATRFALIALNLIVKFNGIYFCKTESQISYLLTYRRVPKCLFPCEYFYNRQFEKLFFSFSIWI